ncbi:hypothetical protein CsSME_00044992 [Camellia sinensis var. sinensis]
MNDGERDRTTVNETTRNLRDSSPALKGPLVLSSNL